MGQLAGSARRAPRSTAILARSTASLTLVSGAGAGMRRAIGVVEFRKIDVSRSGLLFTPVFYLENHQLCGPHPALSDRGSAAFHSMERRLPIFLDKHRPHVRLACVMTAAPLYHRARRPLYGAQGRFGHIHSVHAPHPRLRGRLPLAIDDFTNTSWRTALPISPLLSTKPSWSSARRYAGKLSSSAAAPPSW
jgi:hypothetical protein